LSAASASTNEVSPHTLSLMPLIMNAVSPRRREGHEENHNRWFGLRDLCAFVVS
jgi:hypothetical protein